MTLTDEVLLRYVDGQLDPTAVATVEAALAHDEIAAERVRLLRISGIALQREAACAVPALEQQRLAHRHLGDAARSSGTGRRGLVAARQHRARSWLAIAAGLLLVVGFGVGFLAGHLRREASAHPVWVVRVVDYHTLYGRSTVDGSRIGGGEVAALERRFEDALGRPVKIPAYATGEMEFRRGQILEFERSPIIQLAYLPPRDGTPMALCLKRTDEPDRTLAYERVNGIGMVRWSRAGLDYVLVGDLSERALEDYARRAIEQISATDARH